MSEDEGRGIDLNDIRTLSNADFMAAAELNYTDILDLGTEVTLTIEWLDHVETHVIKTEVYDPDNLLEKHGG